MEDGVSGFLNIYQNTKYNFVRDFDGYITVILVILRIIANFEATVIFRNDSYVSGAIFAAQVLTRPYFA